MADKAPSSEARAAAQRRFLEIAHELEPELVRSLYEDVLPEYPNHQEALGAWLRSSNLFEEWQLRHATHSIWMWDSEDLEYDPTVGWPYLSASYSPTLQSLTPLDVAWDHLTPLDKAEEDALWRWDEYKKEIKAYYKALRGSQTKSGKDPDRHIRWLVRRRILEQTYMDISVKDPQARASEITDEAVRKGVMSAEKLVGLFNNEQPELEHWHDDLTDIHYVVD